MVDWVGFEASGVFGPDFTQVFALREAVEALEAQSQEASDQQAALSIGILVAAIFGFGFAGNMTSLILAIREAVPVNMLGLSTAITTLVAWLGMGVGGFVAGYLFDLTGDYTFAFASAAGGANLMVLAAIARLWGS